MPKFVHTACCLGAIRPEWFPRSAEARKMCNSNRRCDPCQLVALLPSSLSACHTWLRRRRCAISPPAAVVVTHTLAIFIAVCTVSDLTSALRRGTTHLVRSVCCHHIFHGLRCKCGCFFARRHNLPHQQYLPQTISVRLLAMFVFCGSTR